VGGTPGQRRKCGDPGAVGDGTVPNVAVHCARQRRSRPGAGDRCLLSVPCRLRGRDPLRPAAAAVQRGCAALDMDRICGRRRYDCAGKDAQEKRAGGFDDRVYVTFAGTLFGPRPLEPDTPALPDKWSAGDRTRGTRYGHRNAYRTQLLVSRVVAAARVPAETPWSPRSFPDDLAERKLTFRQGTFPYYPYDALVAGIEGQVEVEVTLKEGKVVATLTLAGDRALAAAAIGNIETWTFSSDVNKTFVTRFVYSSRLVLAIAASSRSRPGSAAPPAPPARRTATGMSPIGTSGPTARRQRRPAAPSG